MSESRRPLCDSPESSVAVCRRDRPNLRVLEEHQSKELGLGQDEATIVPKLAKYSQVVGVVARSERFKVSLNGITGDRLALSHRKHRMVDVSCPSNVRLQPRRL